jgi:undecaprenyl-diphosphatase
VRILRGLSTSIARREVSEPEQRLGWLLVLATIPVGISGLALEHVFRTYLSKPVPTAMLLVLNGGMSRDTCARCPETSHGCPRQDSNLRHTV